MKKFIIEYKHTEYYNLELEADSAEQAREIFEHDDFDLNNFKPEKIFSDLEDVIRVKPSEHESQQVPHAKRVEESLKGVKK